MRARCVTYVCLIAALAFAPTALGGSWTARPLDGEALPVHATPGGEPTNHIDALTPTGSAAALLVVGAQTIEGVDWLQVRLPIRPNDATGWVEKSRVDLRPTEYRVVVDLSERMLRLYRGRTVVLRTSVVIGKDQTPTPRGLFALWQTVRVGAQPTGPYELHITAHSTVLTTFKGGPGRVAIHGMQGDLRVPVGSAASNGCIRVPTGPLMRLVRQLPPGAPILIRA